MLRRTFALAAMLALIGGSLVFAQPEKAEVTFTISGMHCGGCAKGITAFLKKTGGVISAEVNYERAEARVEYEPAKTSPEKLIEAIEKLGYKAKLKQ